MASRLVVGGQAAGALCGLQQHRQCPLAIDFVPGPPVVVGQPVKVFGPELFDGLDQPGMEATAGHGWELGGSHFLDEGVGQAVNNLGPFVVLDDEAGFHQAANHGEQLVGVECAGSLQQIVG